MNEHTKSPIRLNPISKESIWGGTRLKSHYGKTAPFDKIAESWELTLREDGENTAANGIFNGQPLSSILGADQKSFLGTAWTATDRFPLLIKLIDAEDDLSIQVHPDDSYALQHENELGKTEMWYIAEADEGARLVLGLKDNCSVTDFANAAESSDDLSAMLNYVDVKKGDVFFIPPGMVHAIGKGILIAEIQQNSNVTYRVFDYNRPQADGSLRPLHTQKALDVVRSWSTEEISRLQFKGGTADPSLLCSCDYFAVNRYEGSLCQFNVAERSFAHLLVLASDNAELCWSHGFLAIAKGESLFLPAGIGEISIRGQAHILVTTLP